MELKTKKNQWIISAILLIFILPLNSMAEITKSQFISIQEALILTFPQFKIVINNPKVGFDFWWNLDSKSASYSSGKDSNGNTIHYLFFFGGLARMPEMTMEGAALILCHELGHGVGGEPYKRDSLSSVEGQADYYATKTCLPLVLERMELRDLSLPQDPLNICQSQICRYLFLGIDSERSVINLNNSNQSAEFHQLDPLIAHTINTDPFYYPSNQCRLDTLVAGALGKERPRCWWTP